MAALKYYYEFDSLSVLRQDTTLAADGLPRPKRHRKFRVEIWDMRAVSGLLAAREVRAAGDTVFNLEWPSADKFTPILSSVATFTLMAEEDFQFLDLHTDDIQKYQVRLIEKTDPNDIIDMWRGWLNTETYEEELYRSAGGGRMYPVQFYASDFNVLKRMKFVDVANGGVNYTGTLSLSELLGLILEQRLGLIDKAATGGIYWDLSTNGSPSGPGIAACYIDCANWYDEDGEPSTLWEVVEDILRPFVGFVYGKHAIADAWRPWITDYNYTIKNDIYSFPAPLLDMKDGRGAETGTAGTDGTFGFEPLLNGLTVTSSRYASNELQDWSVNADNLQDFVGSEIAFDAGIQSRGEVMRMEWYSSAKGFNVSVPTGKRVPDYVKLVGLGKNAPKDEEWCRIAWAHDGRLADTLDVAVTFEDKDSLIYSNDGASLNINMDVKVGQLHHNANPENMLPDFLNEGKLVYTPNVGGLVIFNRFELIDAGGNVLQHLQYGWGGSAKYSPEYKVRPARWAAGADTTALGAFLCCVRPAKVIEKSDGLHHQTFSISMAQGKVPPDLDGVNGVPLPTKTGYLRWTINRIIICGNKNGGDNKWLPFRDTSDHNALWGVFINNIRFGTIKSDEKTELADDDVVHTSTINMNAENEMEEVTLRVCNSYAPNLAIGKGDLFEKVGGSLVPIPASAARFERLGRISNLEKLLVGSYHSNYTGLFKRFVTSIQFPEPYIGCKCKYGRYSSGAKAGQWIIPNNENEWYFVRGQKIDFRAGTSELDCVQISQDNKDINEIK